ncbi:response regulator, partial [Streptococcus pneumoniae]|uniref:hypothetical protein n=1 Tax=Streptococcus pneumoniae TaxID=1313 RepID=UPI00099B6223
MRIFVLEDDFSQQTRIEATIEKLLKEHHITPSSFNPNHSYLSQLDVTYKTPDLMSHFLPPHE